MISNVCQNSLWKQKSKFSGWILPWARFSHSLVHSHIQRALSSDWAMTWIWSQKVSVCFRTAKSHDPDPRSGVKQTPQVFFLFFTQVLKFSLVRIYPNPINGSTKLENINTQSSEKGQIISLVLVRCKYFSRFFACTFFTGVSRQSSFETKHL